MPSPSSDPTRGALELARRTLTVLLGVNAVYAAAIVALAVALLLAPDPTMTMLGARADADRGRLLVGMHAVAALGLTAAVLMRRVLHRLRDIVDTVTAGDPFTPANAQRLERIAWHVLALELLHLAIGAVVAMTSTREQPFDVGWTFSFTPWLAVVLLFVLARVFAEGARLREDLEAVI
jgi:hypothetical protein